MPPIPSPDAPHNLPPVREIPLGRPLRWFLLGWRDFTRAMLPGALHGLAVALGGLVVVLLAREHFYLVAGGASGFLLVAPALATGLYELSRRLARGEPATLGAVGQAWVRSRRPLLRFGVLLMAVGTLWVAMTAALMAVFVREPVTGLESFLRHVVLSPDSGLFLAWVVLGGTMAGLVFAATVVAVPMLLDREADVRSALLASIRTVATNPLPMALWASLVMLSTVLGMATAFIGLVLALPVLGHASWHAYVDLVDASTLPPRR